MWKKQFYNLYFNGDNGYRDTFEGEQLKNENFPLSLYKYTKAEYGILTIENDLIKISKCAELNDPYEGDLMYDFSILYNFKKEEFVKDFMEEPIFKLTKEDEKEILDSENSLNKLIYIIYHNDSDIGKDLSWEEFQTDSINILKKYQKNEIEEFNNRLKNSNCLVCLSEKNDINPMWAHYADSHKGVCIEYDLKIGENDTNELNEKSELESIREGLLNECCFPVYYVEHNNFSKDLELLHDKTRNKLKILEEPFLKKSVDWGYEKEWRIILNKDRLFSISEIIDLNGLFEKVDGKYFIRFPKPKAVYLGLKIEKEYEDKILMICTNRRIPVYKMKKDISEYNLTYEQII